ncbi:DNA-binding transcriptional MerR regulator [Variovorax boronicumulans]|uniref:MerR family DNA-binding protein n=1 Tax=Variovorax boronicumulans TaxID=436515 RepID=UPI002784C018|nr:MerR family DNA-binding protein [Variovorax boronicumulans]MDQ0068588.1 DNA-binding transcriptional MerR regulator [Variovorax boronicumulans]
MNPCNNTPEADRHFDIEAALAHAGVSERLLHQCEARGLIDGAAHTGATTLRYTSEHISVLRFARRALALGFGMNEIAALLALWRNEHRTSAEVKHVALSQAAALASRIEELQATKRVLERLANLCRGDHQPACPILDELLELKGFASQWHGEAKKPPRVTASAAGCRCAPASR